MLLFSRFFTSPLVTYNFLRDCQLFLHFSSYLTATFLEMEPKRLRTLFTFLAFFNFSSNAVQMTREGCGESKGCLFRPAGCDPMVDCTLGKFWVHLKSCIFFTELFYRVIQHFRINLSTYKFPIFRHDLPRIRPQSVVYSVDCSQHGTTSSAPVHCNRIQSRLSHGRLLI